MRITRDRPNRLVHLDQQAFIEKALDRFGFLTSSPVVTPGTEYSALYSDESPLLSKQQHELYMQISGSINYAAISTRPDLSHANSITSRFNHEPHENHFVALKRILRYLRGSSAQRLTLDGKLNGIPHSGSFDSLPHIVAFSDSDHAGDPDGRKSISGCVIKLNNCPVIWYSRKQNAVSRSSCEAEIIAMGDAVVEVKWLQELLNEIFNTGTYSPSTLYVDNSSTVTISRQDLAHTKTRHIAVNYYWIKDFNDQKRIKYKWIRSQDNQADIFTKPLHNPAFSYNRQLLMGA